MSARAQRLVAILSAAVMSLLAGFVVAPPPAAAAPGDPVAVMFGRGMDHGVWFRMRTDAAGWQEWKALGGLTTGTPSGELLPDGRIAVFIRGWDGALWMRSTAYPGDMTIWAEWESLGGQILDAPIATHATWETQSGWADVFVIVRGTDRRLYDRTYSGSGGWSGWAGPGQVPYSGPVTVSSSTFSITAAGLIDNGNGWATSINLTGAIGGEAYIGGPLLEAPLFSGTLADSTAIGRLTDRSLGFKQPGLYNYVPLGGIVTHGPTRGPRATVLGRGVDAGVWTFDLASWSWASLGGRALEAPVGAPASSARFLLTVRGLDHGVWARWSDDTTGVWGAWENLGGQLRDAPSLLMFVEADSVAASDAHGGKRLLPPPRSLKP